MDLSFPQGMNHDWNSSSKCFVTRRIAAARGMSELILFFIFLFTYVILEILRMREHEVA
jgi:hypothetical protein